MNLLLKMRSIKDLLPSERHVVEYIFDNLQDVSNIELQN